MNGKKIVGYSAATLFGVGLLGYVVGSDESALNDPARAALMPTTTVTTTVTAPPPPPELIVRDAEPSATVVAPAPATITTTAPAPAPVTTVTERVVVQVPQACLDYLSAVDAMAQSIYDYETGIAPEKQIFTDATQAIANSDSQALNDVKSRHIVVMNETTGPLQSIIGAQTKLATLKTACDEAKD